MTPDAESLSALDSLYFRWQAFRTAGREVSPAVLCRDRPGLANALAARIAAEHPSHETQDTDRTGGYEPSPASDTDEELPWGGLPESPDEVAGRYHVLAEHARGGMGRVCVAVDTELNRRVAFKDIQAPYADDKFARHRFLREALITGQLEHPGVIPVYGLGTDPAGRPYYAMRFVEGDSLKAAVKAFHADPPKRVPVGAKAVAFRGLLKRFADVCNAVAFAHSRNIVHRDLKPANVMLGPFGETLVVDWGLARSFSDRSADPVAPPGTPVPVAGDETDPGLATTVSDDQAGTRTGQVMGTPAYMSPEQSAGKLKTLGPAWDIYSLGATLYELLAGRPPFTGKPVGDLIRDIQSGTYPSPREVAPWVPKPLDAVARKAMALDPADRYATALELAAEIDRYLADEPVLAHRDSAGERLHRWARRNRGWVRAGLTAGLVTLVILGVSLFVVNDAREEAVEAERLKTRALDSEKKQLATTRAALAAEETANAKARAALNTVTDEVVGRLLGKQAGIGPEERKFLAKVIANYEQLTPGEATTPTAKGMAAQAKLRVGQIYEKLGDKAAAAKQFRLAVDGFRSLAAQPDPTAEARRGLAASALGFARAHVNDEESRARLAEGYALRKALYEENRADRQRAEEYAAAMFDMADASLASGKVADSRAVHRQLIGEFAGRVVRGEVGFETAAVIGRSFDQLAFIAEYKAKDLDAAYRELDKALSLFTDLDKTFPAEPSFKAQKNSVATSRAMVKLKHKKPGEAVPELAAAARELAELVDVYPAVRTYRAALATALVGAAVVADAQSDRPAFKANLTDARTHLRQLHRAFPEEHDYRDSLLNVTKELARIHEDADETDKAKALNREALELEKAMPKK